MSISTAELVVQDNHAQVVQIEGISVKNIIPPDIISKTPREALTSLLHIPELVERARVVPEGSQTSLTNYLITLAESGITSGNTAIAGLICEALDRFHISDDDLRRLDELKQRLACLYTKRGFFAASIWARPPSLRDLAGQIDWPDGVLFQDEPTRIVSETVDPMLAKLDPNGDTAEFGSYLRAISKAFVDEVMFHAQITGRVKDKFANTAIGEHRVYAGWISEDIRQLVYSRLTALCEKFLAFAERLEADPSFDKTHKATYLYETMFHLGDFPMCFSYIAQDESWGIPNLPEEMKARFNRLSHDNRFSDVDYDLGEQFRQKCETHAKELIQFQKVHKRHYLMKVETGGLPPEAQTVIELLRREISGAAERFASQLRSARPLMGTAAVEASTLSASLESYSEALALRVQVDDLIARLTDNFRTPIRLPGLSNIDTATLDERVILQMTMTAFGNISRDIASVLGVRALQSAQLIDTYRLLQIADHLGMVEAQDRARLLGVREPESESGLPFDELLGDLSTLAQVFVREGHKPVADILDILARRDTTQLPSDYTLAELDKIYTLLLYLQPHINFDAQVTNHTLLMQVAKERMAIGLQCSTFSDLVGVNALRLLLESQNPLKGKRSRVVPLVISAAADEVGPYDVNHGCTLVALPGDFFDGYRFAFVDPNLVYTSGAIRPYIPLLKPEDITVVPLRAAKLYPYLSKHAMHITFKPNKIMYFDGVGGVSEMPAFYAIPQEAVMFLDREWTPVSESSLGADMKAVDWAAAKRLAPADPVINFQIVQKASRSIVEKRGTKSLDMMIDEAVAQESLEILIRDYHRYFLNRDHFRIGDIFSPEKYFDHLLSVLPLALYLRHQPASLVILQEVKKITNEYSRLNLMAKVPDSFQKLFQENNKGFFQAWANDCKNKRERKKIAIGKIRQELESDWIHLFPEVSEREMILANLEENWGEENTTAIEQASTDAAQTELIRDARSYSQAASVASDIPDPDRRLEQQWRDQVARGTTQIATSVANLDMSATMDMMLQLTQYPPLGEMIRVSLREQKRILEIVSTHPMLKERLLRMANMLAKINARFSLWRMREIHGQLSLQTRLKLPETNPVAT